MDIVFVNSMYFQELHTTDLGSIILQNRLDKDIESIIIILIDLFERIS